MRKKLQVPPLNKFLAEETGIHIGDGHMTLIDNKGKAQYSYTCSFNYSEDKAFADYFIGLMKKVYNLEPSYIRVQNNTLMVSYCNKELILFKKNAGLPVGRKGNITMPSWIRENDNFTTACIRGIFDTDGSLKFQSKHKEVHYYPVISASSESKELIHQIKFVLNELGICCCTYLEDRIRLGTKTRVWKIQISGKKNLQKYLKTVGFSNSKHHEKLRIWSRYGLCPPNLDTTERNRILKGEVSPNSFYYVGGGIRARDLDPPRVL